MTTGMSPLMQNQINMRNKAHDAMYEKMKTQEERLESKNFLALLISTSRLKKRGIRVLSLTATNSTPEFGILWLCSAATWSYNSARLELLALGKI